MLTDQEQQALAAIADRNGGVILPQAVIEAAREPDSPLHKHFTWDMRKAAQERWTEQACQLIRKFRVEVTYHEYTFKAPAFLRDPRDHKTRSYVSLGRLQTDEEHAREVVIREFARAAEALKRAKVIAVTLGLDGQIADMQANIENLIGQVQAPVPAKRRGNQRPSGRAA